MRSPPAFHNRPSRGLRPRAPPEALPYPILRGLSRPLWAALRRAPGRSRGGCQCRLAERQRKKSTRRGFCRASSPLPRSLREGRFPKARRGRATRARTIVVSR